MSRSANAMQALTFQSRIEQGNRTEELVSKNGAVFACLVVSINSISVAAPMPIRSAYPLDLP